MGRYVIRRLLWMLFVLWAISVITFGIFYMIPGDPATLSLPRGATPEALEQVRERMGLNDPVPVQYFHFLFGDSVLLDGAEESKGLLDWPPSFGYSFRNQQPVRETIVSRLPVTAALAVGSATLWLLMGIPIGILAATKPRSLRDRVATFFALTGVSMPTFFLGILMLYFFFFTLTVSAGFTFQGRPLFAPGWTPLHEDPLQWAQHLVLPCMTIALTYAAIYSRMVRGTLLDVLGEDYIRTARAKGLSERRVTYKHGLRSALTPVVTLLGLDLGGLLGGAIVSERVFNLPGVGALAIGAIQNTDLPVIMGTVLFASFFVVFSNIVIDIVYAMLDARVRYS
jgi:peptide/nickel transport system permease protein